MFTTKIKKCKRYFLKIKNQKSKGVIKCTLNFCPNILNEMRKEVKPFSFKSQTINIESDVGRNPESRILTVPGSRTI